MKVGPTYKEMQDYRWNPRRVKPRPPNDGVWAILPYGDGYRVALIDGTVPPVAGVTFAACVLLPDETRRAGARRAA